MKIRKPVQTVPKNTIAMTPGFAIIAAHH